jgi:hypothetical protein
VRHQLIERFGDPAPGEREVAVGNATDHQYQHVRAETSCLVDGLCGVGDAARRRAVGTHAGEEATSTQRRRPYLVLAHQPGGLVDTDFGDLVPPESDPLDARVRASPDRLG